MRRIASVLAVIVLAFCFSGVPGLIVPEPCAVSERGSDDGSCPPTCVQCGCCAHPIIPIDGFVERADDSEVPADGTGTPSRPQSRSRGVFHVPKPVLA